MSNAGTNLVTLAQSRPPQGAVRILRADAVDLTGAPNKDALRSRSYEFEDEFSGQYGEVKDGVHVLVPPYIPRTLEAICQQNNTLPVCVDAMVTNVHGTGFDIVAKEGEGDTPGEKEDPRLAELRAFFEESYIGESFDTCRNQIGYDLEQVGWAALEFIRNLEGKLVFVRRSDPKLIRLVKLDAARLVEVEVTRDGKTFKAMTWVRYRRFVQLLGGTQRLFFKAYGCPLRLHSKLGTWIEDGQEVEIGDLASELMFFKKKNDSLTPYGVPAWVPQMPSVIGSRKAEEHNLQYFDAGAVPPFLVLVHGGTLVENAADELRSYLQGGKRNAHQIPVIETVSTSGSTDSAGSVRVTIERFGSERMDDSMFENYDKKCEERVRRSWRLPPIFAGMATDYNYATALASYAVGEAQVFAPERLEFDNMINRSIMRELDPERKYVFRSRPVTVKSIENQFKAIDLAVQNQVLSRTQLVKVLNEISSLALQVDDDDIATSQPPQMDPYAGYYEDPAAAAPANDTQDQKPKQTPGKAMKTDGFDPALAAQRVLKMFRDGCTADELLAFTSETAVLTKADRADLHEAIGQQALGGGYDEDTARSAADAMLTFLFARS